MIHKVCLLFLLVILLFGHCAFGGEHPESQNGQPERGIRYSTVISGEIDNRILQTLKQVSDTKKLESRFPMTMPQLHRRARADIQEFNDALRSFGFYAAVVDYSINDEASPVLVEFKIDPGPPYLIAEVQIISICPEMTVLKDLPGLEQLELEKGSRIGSSRVLDARHAIAEYIRNSGYPFPIVELSEVVIDHRDQSAKIFYTYDPGPEAVFGQAELTGLSRVKEDYVLQRLPWQEGDPFKASLQDRLRRDLTASGLFTVVEVQHAQELEDDSYLPMTISLTERKPRTVRAGLSYQTDTGPEIRLGWVNRNFKGMGEVLEGTLILSDENKSLKGSYTIPAWIRKDQNLIFRGGITDEKPEAYEARSIYAESLLERLFTEQFSARAGLGYRVTRVEQFGDSNELGLFYVPTDLTWDTRDDILDPGTGMRLNLKLIPFMDTLDPKNKFVKIYASMNAYLEIISDKRLVLANRMAVGAINAESKSKVPPDERFYAGGGGSVRGYAYQTAGELVGKSPAGGMSLAEINSEVRLKLTRRSGLVAFYDGGRAFDTSYPNFDDRLYWGWGFGYRYYTDFGPIRADVAFPINRRKGVDDRFQIYISLGQAF